MGRYNPIYKKVVSLSDAEDLASHSTDVALLYSNFLICPGKVYKYFVERFLNLPKGNRP